MFVDTHAHLTDKVFQGREDEIIKLANDMGIEAIITSSVDLESAEACINLSKRYQCVYSSVGLYPEFAESWNGQVGNDLATLAMEDKVVAIGEIGLQYTDGMPDRGQQEVALVEQLKLAYQLKKPVVLHCREAYGAILEILKKNKALLKYGATMHCFSGSKEIAKELLKLDLYFSVGGVSTFKNALALKETLKFLPLERLLFETDSPYLSPHPYRGQVNMPSTIGVIAQNLANIKDIPVEEVAREVRQNTRRLFGI